MVERRPGDVPIERRGRDAEVVRNLRHTDVGIGQQRLGSLDIAVGSGCARIPPARHMWIGEPGSHMGPPARGRGSSYPLPDGVIWDKVRRVSGLQWRS